MFEADRAFSKSHPLRIRDEDIFLHGTSSKRFAEIEKSGFLLRTAPNRNYSISTMGVCFEKYCKASEYAGVTRLAIKNCCKKAAFNDKSDKGIVLKVSGRNLKALGPKIYADWNKRFPIVYNSEHRAIDVKSEAPILSIVVEYDIPIRYLQVVKKLSFSRSLQK